MPPHLHACIYYTYCAVEWVHPTGVAFFPFDDREANLLAGPGNIRARVPAGGHVIITQGESQEAG